MPTPTDEFIAVPSAPAISVSLDPAHNAIHSLLLLQKARELLGLNEWVTHTVEAMTDDERHNHTLVFDGLYFAALPEQSWPSLPAYVDHLAAMQPQALRDKLMDRYVELCVRQGPAFLNKRQALESVENYLTFLRQGFGPSHVHVDVETETFRYVTDPPAMQELIVSHLRTMWEKYLAQEWERVRPMLQDAVNAFRQIDFSRLTRREAVRVVTGQTMEGDKWERWIERAERIVFVPNAHVGPYLGKYVNGKTFGILFGARLPKGVQVEAPDLSRAEIVVRLGALADDTRLRILKLIADRGELCSHDIMQAVSLSQPAASRHLAQLSAAGYLSERRRDGSKCYRLNPERIEEVLQAISGFLLAKPENRG